MADTPGRAAATATSGSGWPQFWWRSQPSGAELTACRSDGRRRHERSDDVTAIGWCQSETPTASSCVIKPPIPEITPSAPFLLPDKPHPFHTAPGPVGTNGGRISSIHGGEYRFALLKGTLDQGGIPMSRRPFPTLSLMLFLALVGNYACGDEAGSAVEKRTPGLIGLAHKNGDSTGIAYHYPHGKVFPADLIRARFHDGESELPSVEISLVGYVEVPQEMAVDVYHAAGGVNRDHGTLFLDGCRIGQVGDDTAKSVVYTLTLPEGTHEIRWVLTGGTFQTNLLKFQAAKTGDLLSVYHTAKQRDETGAAKAATTIDAQGTVEGWPPVDPKAWIRMSMDRE